MSRVGQPDFLWVSSSCRAFRRFIDYIGPSVDQFGYIARPEGLLYVYRKDRQFYDFRQIALPGHTWKTGWGMYGAVQFVWLPEPIQPRGTYGELRNLVRDDIPVRVWLNISFKTAYTMNLMRKDGFKFLEYEKGFPGVKHVFFENDGDAIYGDKVSDEEGACDVCHQTILELAHQETTKRSKKCTRKRVRVVKKSSRPRKCRA